MAGRPRKPNALKKLSGTDQPCRMDYEIDFGKVTKIPPPPKYLNKEGRKIFKTTAARLAALDLLTDVNLPIVVAFSNEMSKYWEAEQTLSESGRMNIVKDDSGNILKIERLPLDKMSTEYLNSANRLAQELGITPASSSRIKMPGKQESNPFANF